MPSQSIEINEKFDVLNFYDLALSEYAQKHKIEGHGCHLLYNKITGSKAKYKAGENYKQLLDQLILDSAKDADLKAKLPQKNLKPPSSIHWVGRKSKIFFDFASLNEIYHCLDKASIKIKKKQNYLDFGCSSGRTVRTLATLYPDSNFHGCDPDKNTIKWAKKNHDNIDFLCSPQLPSLEYDDNYFQGIVSISVFSHLRKKEALDWFDELNRVIKPNGFLYFTSPGYKRLRNKLVLSDKDNQNNIRKKLLTLLNDGFYFKPSFKNDGNRDLDTAFWGEAGMTLDWVVKNLSHNWNIAYRHIGGNRGQQDVYVLVKK